MKIKQGFEPEPTPELQTRTEPPPGLPGKWCRRHPFLAILLVAALAVGVNNYPIIFCGRSYVSPERNFPMLHAEALTFPDLKGPAGFDHGSDVGAALIGGVPMGFIESRALMEQKTLPLWNRYGHAGSTFIGQAITMLGDPLQLIVIFGRGAALAWDIKYLVVKFIFSVGFGLLVLRLTGSLPLGLLFTALGTYCGAFFFINNHPAFFVFSYAPWILLSALQLFDSQSGHYVRWGWVWLWANFGCFTGGHVEPAVLLIGGLNFAALVYSLAGCGNIPERLKVLTRMVLATLVFLGLTAPIWMSFLASLSGSYSAHENVRVRQLPIPALLGLFDDVFFRLPLPDDSMEAPACGTSLLVAVGCFFSWLRWRRLRNETFFWINTGAIILWSACMFQFIPPSVLQLIPFVNRIGHIYMDLSYLMALHLTIQCAYGFKCLAQETNLWSTVIAFFWVTVALAALLAIFSVGLPHRPVPWDYLVPVVTAALVAPLLFVFLKIRHSRVSPLSWIPIIAIGFIPQVRFGLYHTGNDRTLLVPGDRPTLNAHSDAIEKIKADHSGPFRVVGTDSSLFGDYAAVYGLEDIRSCAPLSNGEFMRLLQLCPGMRIDLVWITRVTDLTAARPLLNLLNVKYLLSSPSANPIPGSAGYRVADRSDFVVLENPEAWPRAFFSAKAVSISSADEFLAHLAANQTRPFIALTPDEIKRQPEVSQLLASTNETVTSATDYSLLPNSTTFEIHASCPGVVCLTEGQARDFTATANGRPETVLTVNRAFKGIYLPQPGYYHIVFTYRPRHWRLACTLFLTSLGLIIVLVLTDSWWKPNVNRNDVLIPTNAS